MKSNRRAWAWLGITGVSVTTTVALASLLGLACERGLLRPRPDPEPATTPLPMPQQDQQAPSPDEDGTRK